MSVVDAVESDDAGKLSLPADAELWDVAFTQ